MNKKNVIALDFKDMCKEIGRRIWIVAICAVVLAAILPICQYRSDKKAAIIAASNEKSTAAQVKLTELEQNQVDDYIYNLKTAEEKQNYFENSILMNLNAGNLNEVSLRYKIVGYANESTLASIVDSINQYVMKGQMCSDIVATDNSIPTNYLQELIKFNAAILTNGNASSDVFTVVSYGKDEEQCKAIADNIKNALDTFVSNSNEGYSLEVQNESYITVSDYDLLCKKNACRSDMTATRNGVLNSYNGMTDDQKTVVKRTLNNEESDDTSDNETNQTEQGNISVSVNTGKIVLGAVLGAVIGIIIVLVIYVFNGKIKTNDELREVYGIRLLGRKKDSKSDVEYSVAKIANVMDKTSDVDFIYTNEVCQENIEEYIKCLKEKNIGTQLLGDIGNDAEAVKKVSEGHGVVLAVAVRKTKLSDVSELLAQCKEFDLNVLGYVVI